MKDKLKNLIFPAFAILFTFMLSFNSYAYFSGSTGKITNEFSISAVSEETGTVKYAVAIYGIQEDTYVDDDGNEGTAGLTFGPATGANYVSNYKAHLTEDEYNTGENGICLHWMTWDEIIDQCSIDPTVFEDCLKNGCTHSVEISLNKNDTIASDDVNNYKNTTGDGASILSNVISSTYRVYNTSNTNSYNYWGASTVRATLNGNNDKTYYKSVDADESLFAFFPEELKENIVAKEVKSDKVYNSTSDTNVDTTYDKLWLFSVRELYSGATARNEAEGPAYSRVTEMGITTSDYSKNIGYCESSSTNGWWLRSRYASNSSYAYDVNMGGGFGGGAVDDTAGLAPGFCLPGPEISHPSVSLTPFAVYSSDDNSLTFYADSEVPGSGSTYSNKPVTNVYTGFENSNASTASDVAWHSVRSLVKSIVFDKSFSNIKPTTCAHWFRDMENCATINAKNLDTSAVTTFNYMFTNDSALTDIDTLSGWDVSAVTNMTSMFENCSSLQDVNALADWEFSSKIAENPPTFKGCSALTDISALENWDISRATNLASTFEGCSSLENIDAIAGWDVSKVTAMGSMFKGCSSLTSLDALSGWKTGSDTSLEYTFYNCSALTNADGISGWDTSKVTTMRYAFQGCTNLSELNISNWNTSKVTRFTSMFQGDENLETIYSDDSKFVTTALSSGWDSNMFTDCSALVGGNRTPYDADNVKSAMAHVDTEENPGYFTDISQKPEPDSLILNANGGSFEDGSEVLTINAEDYESGMITAYSLFASVTPSDAERNTASDAETDTVTIELPEPVRDGYIFTEWNTEEDGGGDFYDAGDVIEVTGITLYALWETDDEYATLSDATPSDAIPDDDLTELDIIDEDEFDDEENEEDEESPKKAAGSGGGAFASGINDVEIIIEPEEITNDEGYEDSEVTILPDDEDMIDFDEGPDSKGSDETSPGNETEDDAEKESDDTGNLDNDNSNKDSDDNDTALKTETDADTNITKKSETGTKPDREKEFDSKDNDSDKDDNTSKDSETKSDKEDNSSKDDDTDKDE